MREGREPSLDQLLADHTDIELRLPTLLPDDYIPDVNMRLSIYKRIASTADADELEDLRIELVDRFGLLPKPAQNLLHVAGLRQQATPLGIKRIEVSERAGYIDFAEQTRVSPTYLVGLLQSQPRIYRMDGPTRLRFQIPSCDGDARLQLVGSLLGELTAHQL